MMIEYMVEIIDKKVYNMSITARSEQAALDKAFELYEKNKEKYIVDKEEESCIL